MLQKAVIASRGEIACGSILIAKRMVLQPVALVEKSALRGVEAAD